MFGSDRRGTVIVSAAATSAVAAELRDVIVGRVFNLSPTANLHLRRYASAQSESLALLPVETQLIVIGRDVTGDWLRVNFSGTFGWVFSLYIELSRNGESIDLLKDVPETTEGLVPPGREAPLDSTVPNRGGTSRRQPAIGDLLPPGFEDTGEAVEELLPLPN